MHSAQVAFLRVDTQTILTIDSVVITRSSRVTVRHSLDRDDALLSGRRKTWQLVVKDVQPADAGAYMCQLNTEPMVFQQAFLHVTGVRIQRVHFHSFHSFNLIDSLIR